MLPIPEETKRKVAITKIYAAMGRLAAQTEHTNQSIISSITFLFLKKSEGKLDTCFPEIAFSTYNFQNSKRTWESLFGHIINNEGEFSKKVLKAISKKLDKISQKRNDLIHSTMFIGWGNENTEDWSLPDRIKPKRSIEGISYDLTKYSAEDIQNVIKDMLECQDLVVGFSMLVLNLNDSFSGSIEERLKRNFSFANDGSIKRIKKQD